MAHDLSADDAAELEAAVEALRQRLSELLIEQKRLIAICEEQRSVVATLVTTVSAKAHGVRRLKPIPFHRRG